MYYSQHINFTFLSSQKIAILENLRRHLFCHFSRNAGVGILVFRELDKMQMDTRKSNCAETHGAGREGGGTAEEGGPG